MERIRKHRAWHREAKEMLYASSADIFKWLDDGQPIEIMDFCGRLDKAGKEIYEGDRCKCRMLGFDTHVEEVETVVSYDLTVGGFRHTVTSKHSDYKIFGLNSNSLISCEIIGDIYSESKPSAR